MRENRVKRVMREGGLALGAHVGGIADPQIVEIIGLAGFDAAFIDMEHTSFDLRDVQLMVMAAERVGITPIVRTPGFDPAFILRLLDMGVQGIYLPHVSNAAAARAAVKAVRYAPLGDRGMASLVRDRYCVRKTKRSEVRTIALPFAVLPCTPLRLIHDLLDLLTHLFLGFFTFLDLLFLHSGGSRRRACGLDAASGEHSD